MRKERYAHRCIAALVLPVLLAACQTAPMPAHEQPGTVTTAQINGYPMAYVAEGKGPTVVLVHGAITDYRYWTRELAVLSTHFRLVAVSLRHYYPEHWNGKGSDFSLERHSADLAEFIEGLAAGPVYLVGHSRGGLVALQTARTHPELVRKLVLMEAPLVSLLSTAGGSAPDTRLARSKETVARFEKGDVEGGLEFYVDAVNGHGAWKMRTEAARQAVRDNAWTVVGEAREPPQTFTCSDVGSLRMPVLLVAGEKSPPGLKKIMAATRKCMPSALLVVIPNAAHQMNQMNPVAFDEVLLRFLSE
jgi:esterase